MSECEYTLTLSLSLQFVYEKGGQVASMHICRKLHTGYTQIHGGVGPQQIFNNNFRLSGDGGGRGVRNESRETVEEALW